MLPNTSIGSNTVIGIGSIITKPIPSNVMAAGTPCKVIKENYYPKKLSAQELENLISPIINYWKEILCPQKGIEDVELNFDATSNIIYLKHHTKTTQFDVIQKTMIGDFTSESEDLRDFLRRRGIKIFTGKPFVSMKKI
jgi:hypothetical protein